MSKYVIKNCPALSFSLGFYCDEHQKKCQDCTYCVIKKIVEECNNAKMRAIDYYRNSYSGGIYDEANRILDFLDIEECE